jgi:oligopeptide transport system substrate-binding protein
MLEIFRSENNVKNNRWVNTEFDRLLGENKTLNDQAKRMENFANAEIVK